MKTTYIIQTKISGDKWKKNVSTDDRRNAQLEFEFWMKTYRNSSSEVRILKRVTSVILTGKSKKNGGKSK